MPSTRYSNNNPFHSKIMLFGEYSIIMGSMALTIPYAHFNGSLEFINRNRYTDLDFARRSNHLLSEYYNKYITALAQKGTLPNGFDHQQLEKDISQGLYFESTIPESYGLGSSGALVAALYHRYVKPDNRPLRLSKSTDILKLKAELAILESWFHGTSSGIDPLICYMRRPLLFKDNKTIKPISIPRYNLTSNDAIFLINSEKSGKTAPLVDQFMKDCEETAFKQRMQNEYIPLNNACIQSLIDGDIELFEQKVRELSMFQSAHFSGMIPSTLEMEWLYGITTGQFMLKLCGSGGGGFVLGFTRHYREVKERFLAKGKEIIPVYQYETI